MNSQSLKQFFLYTVIIVFSLSFFDVKICPFYNLTGIPCPSCGITRGMISILKGEFILGLKYNLFSIFVLVGLILVFISFLTRKLDFIYYEKFINKIFLIFVIFITIYGVVRIIFLFYDIEIYKKFFILFENRRLFDFLNL